MRLLSVVLLLSSALQADPVRVQQTQGAAQGFLIVRDTNGAQIGTGNVQQTTRGGRVTSRVVYKLNDGSIDDGTTVFTQAGVFHVLSDRHIQHGPIFEKPIDVAFDTISNVVTTRDQKRSETKEHQQSIPADVANGITGTVLLNIKPSAAPISLSLLAPTTKGRLITIDITADGEGMFSIGGIPHKAEIYRIHPKLGGVAGAVAPIIGKGPKDVLVWVLQGSAPALVREVCQFSVDGPVLSIELAGSRFPALNR